MNSKKIKRAIISVFDKSNLKTILPILKKFKVEIISSGGTYKQICAMNYKCVEVSDYTGFSEMLDGRVKTLHPKIHGGILNIRKSKKHLKEVNKRNIPNIDLVIVDLYPFEKKIEQKINTNSLIEYIDIGGPTLIRAAAKNFKDVTIISNTSDYSKLVDELITNKGSTSTNFRQLMSAKAFSLTAYYDSVVSNWFNNIFNIKFPEKKTFYGNLIKKLHYGENPHQEGSLYSSSNRLGLKQLHGKNLSFNNYNDIYSSLDILNSFKKKNGVVIIKHTNPCGVSIEQNQHISFKNALRCDPLSAFGGLVAVNSVVSKKLASEISKTFFEIIVARGFNEEALKIFKKKKNLRVIDCSKFNGMKDKHCLFFGNSFLYQDYDLKLIEKKLKIVTKKKPSPNQLKSLIFAFSVCKFVKSNAIVLANNKSIIGIGAGQASRIDSCRIASSKALQFVPKKISNSVAASDAFFPFPDGVEKLIKLGVRAIIQPGGSINDSKIINVANKAGIAMAFTKTRHFKH